MFITLYKYKVVLTFQLVDENVTCPHSNGIQESFGTLS